MQDASYILVALELAKKGKGYVSPKPLTGALVVKNNKIVSAAYRSLAKDESAELTAVKICKDNVEGGTLYTNIEPCSLTDNSEECIDAIVNSKIKRVVIGALINEQENSVIKKFKKSGIEVTSGLLEKECNEINKFFIKHNTTGLPYVTLKMAVTVDGKIADSTGNSKWITSVESRSLVHELRSEYDAVLVGCDTVKKDKPQLTVRLVEGRNPKRIILDSNLDLKCSSDLIKKNDDGNLMIVTATRNKDQTKKLKKLYDNNVNVLFCKEDREGKIDLLTLMKKLGKLNINSLLVEGGGKLFTSFLKKKLEDEIMIFIGPKILGEGISLCNELGINGLSKAYKYTIKDLDKVGEDVLLKMIRR